MHIPIPHVPPSLLLAPAPSQEFTLHPASRSCLVSSARWPASPFVCIFLLCLPAHVSHVFFHTHRQICSYPHLLCRRDVHLLPSVLFVAVVLWYSVLIPSFLPPPVSSICPRAPVCPHRLWAGGLPSLALLVPAVYMFFVAHCPWRPWRGNTKGWP